MKTIIKNRTRTSTIVNLRNTINNFIESSEKYKNSYTWSSPNSSYSRRAMEFENFFSFEIEGITYDVQESLNVSCKNVYYRKRIYVDNNKKDLRSIRKALTFLDAILERRGYQIIDD